jgi:hypothetical protein
VKFRKISKKSARRWFRKNEHRIAKARVIFQQGHYVGDRTMKTLLEAKMVEWQSR